MNYLSSAQWNHDQRVKSAITDGIGREVMSALRDDKVERAKLMAQFASTFTDTIFDRMQEQFTIRDRVRSRTRSKKK